MREKKPQKYKEYNHKDIEKKWQDKWREEGIYKTEESAEKEKCYVLDMFPYPSGEGLHVGHPKGYIATDIYSRFKKMKGFSVLHPMGWDAFGLPAENFAIKNKVHPKEAVEKNIKRYKEQLSVLGFNYDWEREINTTDPEYYKWTQWIFLQMFKKGLAYESNEPINWCPNCKTGLANEDLETRSTDSGQVSVCERCGSVVEKKAIRQWVLRITDYADRLLEDLEELDWPESIKESQRNWIGRSEGAEIEFKIKDSKVGIKVFTTRPDTLFGVTYLVISPEHKMLEKLQENNELGIKNYEEIQKYINEAKQKTEIERTAEGKEKSGVELEGVKAINPANGKEVSVWVADYVLAHYGTGAIMAVPAHDERDWEFARKFDLPIRQVIRPVKTDERNPPRDGFKTVPRKGIIAIIKHPNENKVLTLNWKKQDWRTFVIGGVEEGEDVLAAAKREIEEETGYFDLSFEGQLGQEMRAHFHAPHKGVNRDAFTHVLVFKLNSLKRKDVDKEEMEKHTPEWSDWSVIPDLMHSERFLIEQWLKTGNHSYSGEGELVNSGDFNGLSSEEARKEITKAVGGTTKVNYKLKDWVFSRQRYWGEPIPLVHCKKCGVVPVPEKDLPVALPDVSHYEPTGTGESPLSKIEDWVNISCPECGEGGRRETNTMPQWAGSCWYYLRFMDPKNNKTLVDPKKEKYWSPVDVYIGGSEHATRHLIYARFWHKFLFDIGAVSTREPFRKYNYVGLIMASDGRKMSKRYGNVINPDDVVENWGADTLRVYEMFMGPFEQAISWSTDNMVGSRRFLERVWRLTSKLSEEDPSSGTEVLLHKTIKKVTDSISDFRFNTAISSMMILVNELDKSESVSRLSFETLLRLLTPFAPHITEELWRSLGYESSIHLESWPEFDEGKIVEEEFVMPVQVNGKVRGSFKATEDIEEAEAKERALAIKEVKKWTDGKEIKKVIYVKNKLISLVTD